jgi:hypothetical protein
MKSKVDAILCEAELSNFALAYVPALWNGFCISDR